MTEPNSPDAANDLPSEFKWPDLDDDLFDESDDWWNTAIVETLPFREYGIARGFRDAAEVLVSHLASDPSLKDSVVFPMMFAYRQYLQLMLKAVIIEGREHLNRSGCYPSGHDLMALWSECKHILEAVFPNENVKLLEVTGRILRQFMEVDPSSMAFRHPVNKHGDPLRTHELRVQPANVASVVAGVGNFLDGSVTWIVETRYLSTGTGEEGYF